MLTLLAPTGLLALLGLVVPLAIHLWNRRPGRTVAVGSLRWLEPTANRRLRSLKLEQVGLLLLRSALVGLLALALARPAWQMPPQPILGQVFISPDVLRAPALTAVRPQIDSLRRRGYELRRLAPGFRPISAAAWANTDSLAVAAGTRVLADSLPTDALWARVRQAADSFPNRPLRVFSSAAFRHFQGTKPVLPANIIWQPLPTTDSTRWLQSAYRPTPDSLSLLLGRSDEAAVTFHALRIKVSHPPTGTVQVPGMPPLRLVIRAGGTLLQAADGTVVPVRTSPLRVWMRYDAAHARDARLLQAALRAAALGLAAPLHLSISAKAPPENTPLDWLFWLSDSDLPRYWQQRVPQGLIVWQDAKTPGRVGESSLAFPDLIGVSILRRDAGGEHDSEALWTDGQGRAVLTRLRQGQGIAYQLHTRLDPAWSSLADSPELPALLLPLLQPESISRRVAALDERALDPAQIRTPARPVFQAKPQKAASSVDLRPWAVLAVGLLFALERLLARRRSSSQPTADA